jgi:glycosyltransferase involved in cell wall biosynthesis
MPHDANYITYVPEHLNKFNYTKVKKEKTIRCFAHGMKSIPQFVLIWEKLKELLPEFEFGMYGTGTDYERIPQQEMLEKIKKSMFLLHLKTGGCGYVPRQAISCGIPVIVDKRETQWHNTLCKELLIDGLNCINIDPFVRSLEDVAAAIRQWSESKNYNNKAIEISNHAKQVMNFENEACQIKQWIMKLRR